MSYLSDLSRHIFLPSSSLIFYRGGRQAINNVIINNIEKVVILWNGEHNVRGNLECGIGRSCKFIQSDQVGLRKCHLSKDLTRSCPMPFQSIFSYMINRKALEQCWSKHHRDGTFPCFSLFLQLKLDT